MKLGSQNRDIDIFSQLKPLIAEVINLPRGPLASPSYRLFQMDTLQEELARARKRRQALFVWEGIEAAYLVLEGFRRIVNAGELKMSIGENPHYIYEPHFSNLIRETKPHLSAGSWERQSAYVLSMMRELTGMRVEWKGHGSMIELHDNESPSASSIPQVLNMTINATVSDKSGSKTELGVDPYASESEILLNELDEHDDHERAKIYGKYPSASRSFRPQCKQYWVKKDDGWVWTEDSGFRPLPSRTDAAERSDEKSPDSGLNAPTVPIVPSTKTVGFELCSASVPDGKSGEKEKSSSASVDTMPRICKQCQCLLGEKYLHLRCQYNSLLINQIAALAMELPAETTEVTETMITAFIEKSAKKPSDGTSTGDVPDAGRADNVQV